MNISFERTSPLKNSSHAIYHSTKSIDPPKSGPQRYPRPVPHPSGLEDLQGTLKAVWGYDALRYHQRRVVLAAARGRDCLALLPTGGGKSICFQLPALTLSGLTLVISPLIALMQDQVGALRRRGIAAAFVTSAQSAAHPLRAILYLRGSVKLPGNCRRYSVMAWLSGVTSKCSQGQIPA